MTDREHLIAIAESQIGVEEDPKGSNRIKYNTAYWGREVSGSAYAWCVAFVWWCFKEAGLSSLFMGGGKTARCTVLMNWANAVGQLVKDNYQPGDVLFYNNDSNPDPDHTGIAVSVDGETITTVEGNYGDKVSRVRRKVSEVIGAWRPQYADAAGGGSSGGGVTLTLPELAKGATGAPVEAMQILLEGNGYWVGRCGCDGDFGDDTANALRQYQQYKGLSVDAICGVNTWAKLLGVKAT